MSAFMRLQCWKGTEEIEGEQLTGWFAEYSAPGYMDKTDSVGPYKTAPEAILECLRLYGEEGEGSIASDDELEAIDLLTRFMPETKASRLVLRND